MRLLVILLLALALPGLATVPSHGSESGEWSWQPVSTGTGASLRGVHALGDGVVWATGSGGTVLLTLDGGTSWSLFQTGADEDLRDVHAWDARSAVVLSVTRPARILLTGDGGQSWSEVYRHPSEEAFLDSLVFTSRQQGIVFGDPLQGDFIILTTEDGGRSWQSARQAPAALEGEAAFAASGTCVAARGRHAWIGTGGLSSRVLRSEDGGRSWQAHGTPMIAGTATTGIYSVAFGDALRGVLVGGDYTAPERQERNAAVTTDGGISWTPVPPDAAPRGQRAAVAWVPDREATLLATGRTGTDISLDGGRSWQAFSDEGYYALSFASSGEGWAVGAEGRAARLLRDPHPPAREKR